jgi:hypothetical protein
MFKKIGGRIRDWWKSNPDPNHTPRNFTPKVHPSEQLEKPDRIQFPAITNRHIYINYGFNRKERRRLAASIKKRKKFGPPKGVNHEQFYAALEIDKMMLKANPKNVPCEVKRFFMPRRAAGKRVEKFMKTNNPLYGVSSDDARTTA